MTSLNVPCNSNATSDGYHLPSSFFSRKRARHKCSKSEKSSIPNSCLAALNASIKAKVKSTSPVTYGKLCLICSLNWASVITKEPFSMSFNDSRTPFINPFACDNNPSSTRSASFLAGFILSRLNSWFPIKATAATMSSQVLASLKAAIIYCNSSTNSAPFVGPPGLFKIPVKRAKRLSISSINVCCSAIKYSPQIVSARDFVRASS